jgi:hypothetical protein
MNMNDKQMTAVENQFKQWLRTTKVRDSELRVRLSADEKTMTYTAE